MTAEEKIKESYLEYWDQLPDLAKENALCNHGYIHEMFLVKENGSLLDCIEMEADALGFFRPKSLQGIETNNGWVKIESESDLPQTGIYWVMRKGYETPMRAEFNKDDRFHIAVWRAVYSHYQPIEKPKPPIF